MIAAPALPDEGQLLHERIKTMNIPLMDEIRRACQVLFWIQAMDDVGEPAWSADGKGENLGLRKDYLIVSFQPAPSMPNFLQTMMGRPE